MKILYVKNNSERAREFQLRTTIYEKSGQKYVVKQALHTEAIPHLMKMKENFQKLSAAIINPHVKLAKIIDESKDSLTFEFIEGISLEKKYQDARKLSKEKADVVKNEYFELLKSGFKTHPFDSTTMVTKELKKLFGDIDYSHFDGQLCFDTISNIDLIFSNIIFKNNTIYLIDYEWVFESNICVDYAAYRALHHDDKTWEHMEEHFLNTYVIGKNGFHHIQNQYLHDKPDIVQQLNNHKNHIDELLAHVAGKETHIKELSTKISEYHDEIHNLHQNIHLLQQEMHKVGGDLNYARSIVDLRDKQLSFKNEQIEFLSALTLKRRIKQKIKKVIPNKILTLFGFDAYAPLILPSQNFLDEPVLNNPISEQCLVYQYKVPQLTTTIENEINMFKKMPLISIVMPVYNVAPKWLDLAIKSIENQWYTNWELCLADDKSTNQDIIKYLHNINHPKIKVTFLEKNVNISGATNAALTLATGEYIALMDNDDEITPDALYEMARVINTYDAEFIYSDEDFISTEGECSNPHFKPDFSPDLLLSHNYITHFTCFNKKLLDTVGHFNADFDGAQDYDLFLRLTEQTSSIYHIQKVLYHWRTLETSTSANSEAKPEALERGKRALEQALQRRNIEATVEHANIHHYFRVRYTIQNSPLISIIIPFKDKPELLDMCINSILDKSTYQNYEIIGISNNSVEPVTFSMMKHLESKDTRISFHEYNVVFNYSDINNYAVNTYAKGEHILLLNNDIEIISPNWLESMLEHSQREEVGCVGAKLYYPNNTIQHAGIIMGLGGYAGHSHKMSPKESYGYFNRLSIIQNLSAVTAACLMIKRSIYDTLEGLDKVNFKVAYNDVDFCLRVREKGYLNIFTPYAEAYHHESISRGYEETPEKIARFQTEKNALYKRHTKILENGDPYYNPNLTHDKEDFSVCLTS